MRKFSRAAIQERYPHYFAIRAAAHAQGWPVRFRRDLSVHDRRALRALPVSRPFLWALFAGGTHLMYCERGAGEKLATIIDTIARDFRVDLPVQFYAWDGAELRHMTQAQAKAFAYEHSNPSLAELLASRVSR